MAMHPLDELIFPGIGPLSRVHRERATVLPSQAVEAIRDEFQQALRDAGSSLEQEPQGEDRPQSPPDRTEEVVVLEELPPAPVYGPHGEITNAIDPHRLNLDG